jgi:hypothetical protein
VMMLGLGLLTLLAVAGILLGLVFSKRDR